MFHFHNKNSRQGLVSPISAFLTYQLMPQLQLTTQGKVIPMLPGRKGQWVAHLTQEPEVVGLIPCLVTYFVSTSPDSRRAAVSYWRKYVHEVLVGLLGGLSLPRKSVVRLTERHGMTI